MAPIDSTARIVSTAAEPVAHDGSRRVSVASALGRLLASWRDVWHGASWEPGHDWLTRVADPAERQEPR